MKNTFLKISFITLSTFVWSCSDNKTTETKTFSAQEIEQESKKANDFFDRVFDAEVDRSPWQQATLGIKKDYDKWDDMSEAFSAKK